MEGVTAEPIGVIEATCPAYLRACYVRLVHLSFVPVPSDVSHRQAPLTCGSSVPVARIRAVAGACLPVKSEPFRPAGMYAHVTDDWLSVVSCH